MSHLHLSADEVLSTTRAVRRQLDLTRPVEREVLQECLELVIQAPICLPPGALCCLLGILYEEIMQAALIPVAYTIGSDFHPGPRVPLEQVVHWNRW